MYRGRTKEQWLEYWQDNWSGGLHDGTAKRLWEWSNESNIDVHTVGYVFDGLGLKPFAGFPLERRP